MNNSKISSIVLIVLMAITVVICGLFYFGSTESTTTTAGDMEAPVFTSLLINWTYILILIAAVSTIAFALLSFSLKASNGGRAVIVPLVSFVALGCLLLATYFGADTTPMAITGYEGSHDAWVYRITNMCMMTAAILAVVAIFVTLFGFLVKNFK